MRGGEGGMREAEEGGREDEMVYEREEGEKGGKGSIQKEKGHIIDTVYNTTSSHTI